MIKPTVGRVVWYVPGEGEAIETIDGMVLPAIITGVHSDNLVNLAVFSASGDHAGGRRNVMLLQDNECTAVGRQHCMWMPHQKGQAAKTEALEKELQGFRLGADCSGPDMDTGDQNQTFGSLQPSVTADAGENTESVA